MSSRLIVKIAEFAIGKFPGYFNPLKEQMLKSGEGELFEIYVGKMLLYSLLSFVAIFLVVFLASMKLGGFSFPVSLASGFILALTGFFMSLTIFHSLPFQAIGEKAASINSNLPFAVNHMSAIASAGVSPYIMFKLVSEIKEYKEVSNQFKKIVRNVDTFGMDLSTAIQEVANRSPSESLAQLLHSIVSTIEGGGDLSEFLKSESRQQMLEYKLRRKKYLSLLQTYADFYTALLVAAPMFIISLLVVLAMISKGGIMGMSIDTVMTIAIYGVIPILNLLFIAFLEMTQPEI